MKAGDDTVTTCRKEDGTLVVRTEVFSSVRKKHRVLNLPLIRGVVNFAEMMALSVRTMNVSAEALDLEEEPSRFERFLKKHFGLKLTDFIMGVGVVLGIALAVVLFMFVPALFSSLTERICGKPLGVFKALIEGFAKILIFLGYLWGISFIPDIRRVFMYHGAEHKSIACYEAGAPLSAEQAKHYTRFHPRCGTSFMFFMILIGVIAGLFVRLWLPGLQTWAYVGIRLLILPLVVGIGYEYILYAGKHDNVLTRVLSAPGLWVQRLTTKEPTQDMLEVALISLQGALRHQDESCRAFFEEKPWEHKAEPPQAHETGEPQEAAPLPNEPADRQDETQPGDASRAQPPQT